MPDLYELVELPRDAGPARLRQAYERNVNLAAKRMDQNRLLALSRAYDLLPQATQDAMYPKLSTRSSTLSAMPSAVGTASGKRGRGGRKSGGGAPAGGMSARGSSSRGSSSRGSARRGSSRFSRSRSGPRRMTERRRTLLIAIAVIILVALATQWSRINSAFDSADPADNFVNSTGYRPPSLPQSTFSPTPITTQSASSPTVPASGVADGAAMAELRRMQALIDQCRGFNHGRLPPNAVDDAGLVRLGCGSRSMSTTLQAGEQLVYRQVTPSTYTIALTEQGGRTITYSSASRTVTG